MWISFPVNNWRLKGVKMKNVHKTTLSRISFPRVQNPVPRLAVTEFSSVGPQIPGARWHGTWDSAEDQTAIISRGKLNGSCSPKRNFTWWANKWAKYSSQNLFWNRLQIFVYVTHRRRDQGSSLSCITNRKEPSELMLPKTFLMIEPHW